MADPIEISKMAEAEPLDGSELLEVAQHSPTITITASTISALASDNSFNDSGNGFIAAGFLVGMNVESDGFTGNAANNIKSATITALTAGKMTIGGTDGNVIVDDAAGESVTITAWVTRRATVQEAADVGNGGGGAGSPITYTIDTGSTADSDPGNGLLKFNNATQASATMLYVDNQTADAISLTTLFASLAQTGFLTLTQQDDATVWRVYKVTAVTSASGYYKFTVVNQAGAGSFADDAIVSLSFDTDATGAVTSVNGLTGAVSLNGGYLGAKGADIASAGTTDLSTATGDWVDVTGTTTITALGTVAAGIERLVRFTGVLTLTYNGTSLILPTSASITTANGDFARFRSLGSGNWVCVSYQRRDGTALSTSGSSGLSADELAYWTAQCAMLDPAAFVHLFSSSFTVTVPSGKTYYVFNAWNAQLGTNGGTIFHRNPIKPIPLGEGTNIKGNGTSDAFLYYCDPSLVSYADPKAKYFERMARLQVLVCNHIYATTTAGSSALGYTPFPSDFSNGLIVMAQAFDVAWTLLTNTSAVTPGKCNLMDEVSDLHQWRSANGLMLPFARSVYSGIGVAPSSVAGTAGSYIAGSGSCLYYKLPSDW